MPELEAIHQEIEVFWSNVFANVSSKVETPIHNYLHLGNKISFTAE